MAFPISHLFGGREKKPSSRRARKGFVASVTAAGDRLAFNWKVRQGLYRHLATQNKYGTPVEKALDGYQARLERRGKVSSAKIVADMARRMRDGSPLARAMSAWVPHDEVGIITAGEVSGNLPRALDLVVESKQRVNRVLSSFRNALISPAIYSVAMYIMLWVIAEKVTPSLQQVVPKERAHGLVYGMFVVSDFAHSFWALLPPIVVALAIVGIVYTLPRWTGRQRVYAENFFPYSFYRDINGYTWLMGFIALFRAGVPDVEILQRQLKDATPWLRERLHSAWWRLQNGSSLPDALMAAGRVKKGSRSLPPLGFPNPDIVDDIASLHGFPDFADKMPLLADEWAKELEEATVAFAKSFGFWMEILMYALMGTLMMAINTLSSQIGAANQF